MTTVTLTVGRMTPSSRRPDQGARGELVNRGSAVTSRTESALWLPVSRRRRPEEYRRSSPLGMSTADAALGLQIQFLITQSGGSGDRRAVCARSEIMPSMVAMVTKRCRSVVTECCRRILI